MSKLLSYDEVLARIGNTDKSLLLGNGFSISYDIKFSYNNLCVSMPPFIENLLKGSNNDIEKVIKNIEMSCNIIQEYIGDDKRPCFIYVKYLLEKELHKRKKEFIENIVNQHSDFEEIKMMNGFKFIKDYKNIFTINYDLLLYWVILQDIIKNNKSNFRDGFIYNFYTPSLANNINIFYLHGAFHIYKKEDKYIKLNSKEKTLQIIEQTNEKLKNNEYPIYILNGTSEEKKREIEEEEYLKMCYEKLEKLDGILVLFGTILKNNDRHLQEAILLSKISIVYVGIGSEDKIHELAKFKYELEKKNKQIFFYDYKTANVWGETT